MKRSAVTLSQSSLAGIAILTVMLALQAFVVAEEKPACTLPDCDQAKAFFLKFQKAVDADQRQEVADMATYPLYSYRDGKTTVLRTKSELLSQYDSVFDAGTRCALKAASVEEVWGNWRGFTVSAGKIWWTRNIPRSASRSGAIQPADLTKYPFEVITVNHSPETEKSCTGNANPGPK